ncbi:MAG: glycosyltransferase, partial [Synergistaceae bacterium]|nr:glycosyltransferase [Synergistaceae bacterium]
MSSEVTPVVSFCIPVYNNAEAAVKIVNSLLSSSDMRFEVVVSDDASTD